MDRLVRSGAARSAPRTASRPATGPAARRGAPQEPGSDEFERLAAIFKTLSDPTRLRLLCALGDGDSCVHDLCARLAMSQPAVSHQLRLLRDARLVRGRRAGREVHYALDDSHVMRLIAQARSHAAHARSRR